MARPKKSIKKSKKTEKRAKKPVIAGKKRGRPKKTEAQKAMNAKKQSTLNKIAQEANLSESYKSLLMGILVVVILGVACIAFFTTSQSGIFQKLSAMMPRPQKQVTTTQLPKKFDVSKPTLTQNPTPGNMYKVQDGEYLWDIAVRAYGDGDRWQDIVKANNFPNPDYVAPGTVIKIPR